MNHRAKVALGCGITGGVLIIFLHGPWLGGIGLPALAFVGAAIAGAGFSAFFGGQGRRGWLMAALGSVVATLVGSFVAGLPLTLLYAINGAPAVLLIPPAFVFAVIAGLAGEPLCLPVWLLGMAATHLAARREQTFPSG